MQSGEVAENREAWTGARPRLRLFVFTYHGSYDVEVIDHWDCDVSTVIADADYYHTASGKLWSLAVVDHGSDGTQLTWLSGYDYRIAPRTYADHRARQTMQLRYLAAQSQSAKPVVLPDGLRVVR
ncbi:MAG: hypothetical protein SW127_23990, partial [Actinomycetota bacterium]|nr:hypothetical protein [Actinomycetota bacterium]